MPQFDFASFIPQMAWLGLLFAVLYFVVVRATLPRLGKVMQDREDKVLGDIGTAEAAKAEADGIGEAYQAALRKAQDEARALLASARADAQKGVEASLAKADDGISVTLDEAQAALGAARDKAAAEIEAIATEAAGSIVERLTGVRPATDKAEAAAKAALAQG